MEFKGITGEYLSLQSISFENKDVLEQSKTTELSIIWNVGEEAHFEVDSVDIYLSKNQIISFTDFHKVQVKKIQEVRFVRFNRPFYCVVDHDAEVSCKGILFFGASQVPIIQLSTEEEVEKFEILWRMFSIEMKSKDNLQTEMLQIMLKRLIILCTRLYKEQKAIDKIQIPQMEIIREFNYLVETNFRTKHTVAEYAEILHKSPKTLSNLFASFSHFSPLQIIQERVLLEARRLLLYTEKPIKEIGYEIGFEDIQTFSRFFKTKEGISPKEFREKTI
jgi:AraC family transcriptional regulator, transcriptional activator of pobA